MYPLGPNSSVPTDLSFDMLNVVSVLVGSFSDEIRMQSLPAFYDNVRLFLFSLVCPDVVITRVQLYQFPKNFGYIIGYSGV